MEDVERWKPDDALVVALRARSISHSTLSGPDRSWAVASLTTQGWTVASIAARLQCSLRLVQQIKAEPLTLIAMHALSLEHQLRQERGLRHLESRLAGQIEAQLAQRVRTLEIQRDRMLDHLIHHKERHHDV